MGDIFRYEKDASLDKKRIEDELINQNEYAPENRNEASRKAGEICRFYDLKSSDVVVVMIGEKLISLVDEVGPYYFDSAKPQFHLKKGRWLKVFQENEKLPVSEALQTTCVEIKNQDNLLYLYNKYYCKSVGSLVQQVVKVNTKKPLNFKTGLTT